LPKQSEAAIQNGLALIYDEAGLFDKAEEYYRQALILEPENPLRMYYLAWFLIDKDRNV
jgi:Flp pilus assembly protein TadD